MNSSNVPSPESLKTRTSSKWKRFSPDVLPMHVAEMDYEIADNIKLLLLDRIQSSDLGYVGPSPELAESFAKFSLEHWAWSVDQTQVRLSPDVGVSGVEILRALTNPGDSVVINSPVYSSFYGWIGEAGLTPIDVPLIPGEPQWQLDLPNLEQAFRSGASVYLMCNPHNPLGKIFTKDELLAIAKLAKSYNVVVISDEIHAPLTYPGENFVPYLNVSDDAQETGICITSASKAFNLAGLKASILVTASKTMQSKLQKLPPAMHWRTGLLGALCATEAFNEPNPWLTEVIDLNKKSVVHFADLLTTHIPAVKFWVPQAGYLAWLDVSALNIGSNPAAIILEKQKVAFVAGEDHGKQYDQYLRINLACHPDSLKRAVLAIAACAN